MLPLFNSPLIPKPSLAHLEEQSCALIFFNKTLAGDTDSSYCKIMDESKNIFSNVPEILSEEIFEELITSPGVRIERIVSRGHSSPEGFWYDQSNNEWVILLKGRAIVLFHGEESPVNLLPGDYINIPAHVKHRVAWTDPDQETVWLAVHYD